jgi:hypothetical protein
MIRWTARIIGIVLLLIALFLLNRMQKTLMQLQEERGASAPAR